MLRQEKNGSAMASEANHKSEGEAADKNVRDRLLKSDQAMLGVYPLASGFTLTVHAQKPKQLLFQIWNVRQPEGRQCIFELSTQIKSRQDCIRFYLPEGPVLSQYGDRISSFSDEQEFMLRAAAQHSKIYHDFRDKEVSVSQSRFIENIIAYSAFYVGREQYGIVASEKKNLFLDLYQQSGGKVDFLRRINLGRHAAMGINPDNFYRNYTAFTISSDRFGLLGKDRIFIWEKKKEVFTLKKELLFPELVKKPSLNLSSVVMLPDGRVLVVGRGNNPRVAGGERRDFFLCFDAETNQADLIWSPRAIICTRINKSMPVGLPLLLLPSTKKLQENFLLFDPFSLLLQEVSLTHSREATFYLSGKVLVKNPNGAADAFAVREFQEVTDYLQSLHEKIRCELPVQLPTVLQDMVLDYLNKDVYLTEGLPMSNHASRFFGKKYLPTQSLKIELHDNLEDKMCCLLM